jgi:hypothetical protein
LVLKISVDRIESERMIETHAAGEFTEDHGGLFAETKRISPGQRPATG